MTTPALPVVVPRTSAVDRLVSLPINPYVIGFTLVVAAAAVAAAETAAGAWVVLAAGAAGWSSAWSP